MPYDELLLWMKYFERRPVGWRDDLRAHYALQVQGSKHRVEDLFPELGRMLRPKQEETPMASLRGSALFQYMSKAIGGDKVDFI